MTERKEITLEELGKRIQKDGPKVAMSGVQVSGVVVIKDKDGNVKGKMNIVSLETQELDKNAISNSS